MTHPFFRGVDPSEPFDLMAYCIEIGKATYRIEQARLASLDASARHAEAVLHAYYEGLPSPVFGISPPVQGLRGLRGMSERLLRLLVEHGPMTAKQLRAKLGYYQVIPLLHSLHKRGRIVREGRKGSHLATWRVLT